MKTKEFFNNDVEVNVSEEEIVLAPPTELYDEAKEIAQNTSADEKYPFTLQYDANQKDFLQSMLQMVGAIVEDDDEEGHNLSTRMNMTQLAFIKRLESVERVKTEEGRNPFLMEDAVNPETVETQTSQVMTLAADKTVETVAEPAMANANDGIATACESGSSSSCCCPTNKDMQSAQMIEVEKNVRGCICCPGAEQWFKFTVPKQGDYTIYTTGSLDTEGVLYDCCGAEANIYDDTEGKINFRIRSYLYPGQVYYVKVKLNNNDTGNYGLLVTDRILVDSAAIQIYDGEDVIILEKGVTYELPRGDEDYYALLGIEGTTPANFGVELSPGTAHDQRVYWFESGNDVISTEYHWYNNNIKYQTLTAKETGGARLYVRDWCEQGKGDMKYVAVIPNGGSLDKATRIDLCKEISDTESQKITEPLNMEIGDYQKLKAETYYDHDVRATIQEVDWESDNPSVATVTPYGRVKAIAPGTATIRAKAMDGSGVYGCCNVNVSSHIYNATLSENGNEYTFACTFPQCDESFTVPRDQVIGSYVTSSTDPRLGNSQTPLAYGIDVSYAQEEISQSQWNEIANTQIDGHPITFAILRIGIDLADENDIIIGREKDVRFENNYVRAKAAGLHVGCYYYTKSLSTQCAIAAAEQVIEWIGNKQFEYPVFFDIESNRILENVPNKSTRSEICTSFMDKMREAGFFTGLYTNARWITDYLNSSTLFPKYDVWYARYRAGHSTPDFWGWNQETSNYKWPESGRKFGMWQYTKSKTIAPITVNTVCCDVAYKNYPLIIKALHLNNFN